MLAAGNSPPSCKLINSEDQLYMTDEVDKLYMIELGTHGGRERQIRGLEG